MDDRNILKRIENIQQSIMLLALLFMGALTYSIPSLMKNADPSEYSMIMALLTTMTMAFVFLREYTSVKP